ncbi:MAG: flagellar filament capping protein FliD [bacterium]
MTTSVGSVQGLASGIQWQDMVDQLSKIDQARELDPITAAIARSQKQSDAWTRYQQVTSKLSTALTSLRDGSAFDALQVASDSSATSGRTLLTASAQSGAVPGSYQVEVLDVARAEKLSGASFASGTVALALAPGDVAINGVKVSITAADSLNSIRDKINASNTGPLASGVTATVLGTANGASRLVLSSDAAGAQGIELVDSVASGGLLQQLGILDGTSSGGTNADGTSASARFSAANVPIGQLLGLTAPGATTIKVGNRSVSIDLAVDTLDAIAAKITAAGVGARVTAAAAGTRSRLEVDAAVTAAPFASDPTLPDPDSLRVLQMLGVIQGGRSAVAQTIGSPVLTDASSALVTGTTLLSDVAANGGSAGIQAGDTIVIGGRRGDGTAVSLSFVTGPGTTIDDVLAQLNGPGGFGGGTRAASATVGADGRIHIVDGTAGASQLTLSLSVNKSVANGGGTTSVGAFTVETAGRVRAVTQGTDAKVVIDGVLLTRSTNSISDAVNGLTLSLQQAEVGTTVAVAVTRSNGAALDAVKGFVDAYNALQSFVKSNVAASGDLANSTALKASARSFTNTLLADVLGSSLSRTALVGVALNKTGQLAVDETAFAASMASDPAAVRSLFALTGSTTGADFEYLSASDATKAGSYAVVVSSPATRAIATGSASVFPYSAGGGPMHLTVTDSSTGFSGAVDLDNGDNAAAIASKLNAVFNAKRMHLTAMVVGGQLSISGTDYGSGSGFTVAYDAGDTTSATQLGFAAGSFMGTDLAGTIDGVAGVGVGQTLNGAIGGASEGLTVRYAGTTPGALGTATLVAGVAAQMARQVSLITRSGSGTAALSIDALNRSISSATTRSNDVAARLDRRKQSLLKQFAAMEAAIQRITAQGNSITNSINALTALQSNK